MGLHAEWVEFRDDLRRQGFILGPTFCAHPGQFAGQCMSASYQGVGLNVTTWPEDRIMVGQVWPASPVEAWQLVSVASMIQEAWERSVRLIQAREATPPR